MPMYQHYLSDGLTSPVATPHVRWLYSILLPFRPLTTAHLSQSLKPRSPGIYLSYTQPGPALSRPGFACCCCPVCPHVTSRAPITYSDE